MKRRKFLALTVAAVLAASGAHADDVATEVTRQLRGQGYVSFNVSRTFLGRVKIIALGAGKRREIILNPRTGEILRDLWTVTDRSSGSSSNSGSSRSDSVDDDDDDDDDNSGSGSGGSDDDDDDDDDNSGSGSGGSDDGDDKSDNSGSGKDEDDDDKSDNSGSGKDDDD